MARSAATAAPQVLEAVTDSQLTWEQLSVAWHFGLLGNNFEGVRVRTEHTACLIAFAYPGSQAQLAGLTRAFHRTKWCLQFEVPRQVVRMPRIRIDRRMCCNRYLNTFWIYVGRHDLYVCGCFCDVGVGYSGIRLCLKIRKDFRNLSYIVATWYRIVRCEILVLYYLKRMCLCLDDRPQGAWSMPVCYYQWSFLSLNKIIKGVPTHSTVSLRDSISSRILPLIKGFVERYLTREGTKMRDFYHANPRPGVTRVVAGGQQCACPQGSCGTYCRTEISNY